MMRAMIRMMMTMMTTLTMIMRRRRTMMATTKLLWDSTYKTQSLWQHAHHLRRSNPDVVSLLKEGIEMPPPLTQNPS